MDVHYLTLIFPVPDRISPRPMPAALRASRNGSVVFLDHPAVQRLAAATPDHSIGSGEDSQYTGSAGESICNCRVSRLRTASDEGLACGYPVRGTAGALIDSEIGEHDLG